jgi:predicted nicotinamide N-methyase
VPADPVLPTAEPVLDADPERMRAFIRRYTAIRTPPSLPELRLHLADEVTRIWELTEEEMQRIGLDPPFWAFAWAGGQALARYLLDRPTTVAGRSVLDFAAGSGMCGIAARLAGARTVTACDIDPFCAAAVELNAELNRVEVEFTGRDLLTEPPPAVDVVLAGDVSYEFGMSGAVHAWLRRAAETGIEVLVGDPGRRYLPADGLHRLADYDIVTTPDLEEADLKRSAVLRYGRGAGGGREDPATI